MIELIEQEMARHREAILSILNPSPVPVYRPKIGVWVDIDPDQHSPRAWDFLMGPHVEVVAIMSEGLDDEFKYDTQELRVAAALLANKERILTYWPDKSGLLLAEEATEALIRADAFDARPELDLEMNWRRRTSADAEVLLDVFQGLVDVTTVPYHREASVEATFYGNVRRLATQAYTTFDRSDRIGLRPHELPKVAYERALKAAPEEVCIGLAAWDQSRFPQGPKAAMETAFRTALACKPAEIRYWSLKHILRNDYAMEFITEDIPAILKEAGHR